MTVTRHPLASLLSVFFLVAASLATSPAMAQKVDICHKGKKTIRVSAKALPAHKAHGDFLGSCDAVHSEWLLLTCAVNGTVHEVTAATWSVNITPELSQEGLAAGSNCAEAMHLVDEARCEVNTQYGESQAQTTSYVCPSADAIME